MNVMKKYLIPLLFLPVILVFTGCTEKDMGTPAASTVASFDYLATNDGYAPCEVQFNNQSLNALGYSWDFGNGQTSTLPNPKVTYETPGLYTVRLTCTGPNNVYYNQLIKTMVLNIKDPNAGLTQVLYYTSRGTPGNAHMVILSDGAPVPQDFPALDMERPYGIAADTASKKVFVTD